MNQVSAILRKARDRFFHWCPACESMHPLFFDKGWTWNGSLDRPTFTPSFKQTFTHWPDENDVRRGESRVCHYIITDGIIQFCLDSWHGRSDLVAMPAIPPHISDGFGHETQD